MRAIARVTVSSARWRWTRTPRVSRLNRSSNDAAGHPGREWCATVRDTHDLHQTQNAAIERQGRAITPHRQRGVLSNARWCRHRRHRPVPTTSSKNGNTSTISTDPTAGSMDKRRTNDYYRKPRPRRGPCLSVLYPELHHVLKGAQTASDQVLLRGWGEGGEAPELLAICEQGKCRRLGQGNLGVAIPCDKTDTEKPQVDSGSLRTALELGRQEGGRRHDYCNRSPRQSIYPPRPRVDAAPVMSASFPHPKPTFVQAVGAQPLPAA